MRTVSPALEAVEEVANSFVRYMRGRLIIAAILIVFHMAGFWLVGTPWWGLLGFVAGALSVVPFFGFLIAAAAACLVALLLGETLWDPAYALLVMAAGQALEALYLTPKILGRELDMHPLMVFGIVIIGSLLFGPLGGLLAAPLAGAVLLLWRRSRPVEPLVAPEKAE